MEKVAIAICFDFFDLHPAMASNYKFYLESSIGGYHTYFKNLIETIAVGDILECEIESNNPHDQYAVVVRYFKDETLDTYQLKSQKYFGIFGLNIERLRLTGLVTDTMLEEEKVSNFMLTTSSLEIKGISNGFT